MLRREIILRMNLGETLAGTSMNTHFVLGDTGHDRDRLPSSVIHKLIEDGLVEAVQKSGGISIVLLDEAYRWFERRGLKSGAGQRITKDCFKTANESFIGANS